VLQPWLSCLSLPEGIARESYKESPARRHCPFDPRLRHAQYGV